MAFSSLVARSLTVSVAGVTVLDRIDLTVAPGARIGVIGPNGVGKSTLLRALAGRLPADAGSVSRAPADATVGHLPQEADRRPDETGRALLARRTGVAAAAVDLERSAAGLALHRPGADRAYTSALDRWLALGGTDLDARIDQVWASLGLDPDLLDQPTASLSGGEGARMSLAAVLLSRFDVLLLDEPTNDLDFDGLDRLQRFVTATPSALVVVSHDRDFLERTVTDVFELDEHTRTGTLYRGGWQAYQAERAAARRHAEEDHATYQASKARLRERADRQRRWSDQGRSRARRSAETDKFIRHRQISSSEQVAAKAKATERALARLEVVEAPWEGWELRMDLAEAGRSGDVVARLDAAVVERDSFRLGPIDLEVAWADRVAVVGANGSGKTTLIDALLGRVPLTAGDRWIGPGVVVGQLDQARGLFAGSDRLLVRFAAASDLRPEPARSLLAKFGLGADHVERPADRLSPGERTRAGLALLMARGANWLVLDEPTNHLDLPAIEQLESALARWEGTLLVVSHDRRFLDALDLDRTITLG